ncbi:MAG: ISNCY family transposase, partial [Alkalispirochaeta sp.]
MMGNSGTFTTLLGYLESAIQSFPDYRTGKNCVYSIRDAALSAFSVFFMQCPSFLAHQKLTRSETGDDNAHTIFGIDTIPSDNCVRYLIDPVSPQALFPVYEQI